MSVIVRVTATGHLTSPAFPVRVLGATCKATGVQSYGRIFDGVPGGGGVEKIPLQCPAGQSIQKTYENLVLNDLYVDLGGNNGVEFIDLEIETP